VALALAGSSIGGGQEVAEGGGVQAGAVAEGTVRLQVEVAGELGEDRGDPVAAEAFSEHGLPQLDEVVLSRDGHQQPAFGFEDAAELRGVAPRGERQGEVEGGIRPGQGAVGIHHEPGEAAPAAGGEVDGGDREVDPVPIDLPFPGEMAQEEALAAAHVEDRWTARQREGIEGFEQGPPQEFAVSGLQEPPPRQNGLLRIARVLRLAVPRLEQVAVAAAGDIEGMSARAAEGALLVGQRGTAAADGTEEGDHESSALAEPCYDRRREMELILLLLIRGLMRLSPLLMEDISCATFLRDPTHAGILKSSPTRAKRILPGVWSRCWLHWPASSASASRF